MKTRPKKNGGAPRPRARSAQAKEEKRGRLLQAALECFTAGGYLGTSIETITERAGESTGTFYLYFKNKVDVYRTLTRDGMEILKAMLQEAISGSGRTAVEKILAGARAYYRFYREHPGYYKIINVLHIGQQDFLTDRRHVATLNRNASELLGLFAEILRRGVDDGELGPLNAWETANAAWAMLDGLIILEIRNNMDIPGVPLDALMERGLGLLLFGLVRRGSSAFPDSLHQ